MSQVLNAALSRDGQPGQCKFQYISTTSCTLRPWNGNLIKINGLLYQVSGSGVSIANTGLTANVLYYCYAFISGGAVTLEFSTTAYSLSTTSGNVGTMIKTGDDTRTLVGMIFTNTGTPGTFIDTASQRWVRSWFNEPGVGGQNGFSSTIGITATTSPYPEIDVNTRVYMLVWANEFINVNMVVSTYNTINVFSYLGVGYLPFGGSTWALASDWQYAQAYGTNTMSNVANTADRLQTTDGCIVFSPLGLTSSGTATYVYRYTSFQTVRR